ncbi:MAG: aminopeptidase P N-terminal domain-containing protein [Actinomycetota bacterium]|nr:aminopeptidase P N-terminal domain-containing protein [Actinomycetota bacterium]
MAISTQSHAVADDPAAIAAALERRRAAVVAQWSLHDEVVLLAAGEPIHVPGRDDLTYRFRAHSDYFYLTDSERSGGVLAFDPAEGWVDFVRPVSSAERLWEGAPAGQPAGRAVSELDGWLAARSGRPVALLGAAVAGVTPDPQLSAELRRGLHHIRRPKDDVEVSRMRIAERATSGGFAAVAGLMAEGRTERELQIELEAEFFRRGGDSLAFETIVASGPNAAVLHFPPTARPLGHEELVLIDAGAEYRGYASDVTRTFSSSGRLTPGQAALYGVVRRAVEAAVALCTPGRETRDIHLAAAVVIAAGLIDFGLLRGSAEALVAHGAVALFFPHGVGHLLGLGVRDASATSPGVAPDPRTTPGLRNSLALQLGCAITIEPGVYFVAARLGDKEVRERLRTAVNWERADAMIGFGGIRLEQNVLVTEAGPEVLTADIPLLDAAGAA